MTTDTTKRHSPYGQDMDTFIATYIPGSKKELAMAELQLIVLKAMRAEMIASYKRHSPKE
jgi:hypothetical protein